MFATRQPAAHGLEPGPSDPKLSMLTTRLSRTNNLIQWVEFMNALKLHLITTIYNSHSQPLKLIPIMRVDIFKVSAMNYNLSWL